jgi:two-component system sensor histidine kinase/response regulator
MRALVVDDSKASRMMLEQTLLDAGMTAQVARSADEALQLLQPEAWPHVAIIDEGLADGGMLLAERLRARSPHALGVVLLSSRLTGSPVTTERTARILKPVRRSELLTTIEHLGRPVVIEAVPVPLPRPVTAGTSRRAHVLVAEDNPVNQKVARLMLEKCGCRVDVVDNGALAADAVQSGAYDLVLMDLQMPVCDGFEATRRIRALAAPANAIVIVALTANALAGDRERCLAAGMNDYLAKPVRRDALADMIARYLPEGTRTHTAA